VRFFFVLWGIILCSFACCCGGKTIKDDPTEGKKPKPYDPEKAGAVIVNSFDITDKIEFLETEVSEGYNHIFYTMKESYDLAEYNNSIYIKIKKTLYVFDKLSMQKQREVTINLPKEYDFLPNPNSKYYFSSNNGLAVTGSHAFMRFSDQLHPPYTSYLFSVNLDTGNAQYISEEKLGMKYNNGRALVMGYDKIKDALWFRFEADDTDGKRNVYIHYIQYDNSTDSFTKIDEAVWDYKVNSADDVDAFKEFPRARLRASSITGNESWNVYLYSNARLYEFAFFVVDKRKMDALTVPVSCIKVAHLDTFSLPQSIIYDPPYVWIMVERNSQIQMLKLLPNDNNEHK
jgi:hypothetical protein